MPERSEIGSASRCWEWGDGIGRLRELVDRGGVLVIPTESSYALAVDPCNRAAVESVFRIKRRAADQPLPVGPEIAVTV